MLFYLCDLHLHLLKQLRLHAIWHHWICPRQCPTQLIFIQIKVGEADASPDAVSLCCGFPTELLYPLGLRQLLM